MNPSTVAWVVAATLAEGTSLMSASPGENQDLNGENIIDRNCG